MYRAFWFCIIGLFGFWAGGTPAWLPEEAAGVLHSWGMYVPVDTILDIHASFIITAIIAVGAVAGFRANTLTNARDDQEYVKLLVPSLYVFAAGFSASLGWYSGNIVAGVLMLVTATLLIIGSVSAGAVFWAFRRYAHSRGLIPRDRSRPR